MRAVHCGMQPTPPAAPSPPPAPRVAAQAVAQAAAVADAPAATARALPRTTRELSGLRRQRSELSDQLVSAQRRRADVARALERSKDPAVRAGLEQRLGVLDARIAQIEGDIAETGRLITSAPPELLATSTAPTFVQFPSRGEPSIDGVFALLIAVLVLQFILIVRTRTRRRGPTPDDSAVRDAAARLARLEQAVDAIAVEVERVSEGQRFVTRLLADNRAPAMQQLPDEHMVR